MARASPGKTLGKEGQQQILLTTQIRKFVWIAVHVCHGEVRRGRSDAQHSSLVYGHRIRFDDHANDGHFENPASRKRQLYRVLQKRTDITLNCDINFDCVSGSDDVGVGFACDTYTATFDLRDGKGAFTVTLNHNNLTQSTILRHLSQKELTRLDTDVGCDEAFDRDADLRHGRISESNS